MDSNQNTEAVKLVGINAFLSPENHKKLRVLAAEKNVKQKDLASHILDEYLDKTQVLVKTSTSK